MTHSLTVSDDQDQESIELGGKVLSNIKDSLTEKTRKDAPYREWAMKQKPGDRLPRGRYFRKNGKQPLFLVYDEFAFYRVRDEGLKQ